MVYFLSKGVGKDLYENEFVEEESVKCFLCENPLEMKGMSHVFHLLGCHSSTLKRALALGVSPYFKLIVGQWGKVLAQRLEWHEKSSL